MRRRHAGAWALLLAVAALVAVATGASAQTMDWGPKQETDVSPGVLYLKPGKVDAIEDPLCPRNTDRTVPVYGLSPDPPDSQEPARRYDNMHSAEAVDCIMPFQYTAEETFTLEEGAGVSVWVNCHRPTPALGDRNGLDNYDYNWAFMLLRNGEHVARFDGYEADLLPGNLCWDETNGDFRLNGVLEPGPLTFEEGDTLQLWVAVFHHVSAGNTTYLHVDGYEAPSALYGVGLPGTVRSRPTSTLWVEAPDETRMGPGKAANVSIPVHNEGDTSRTVDLQVDGPPGWEASVWPRSVEVPAGGTASTNLTVGAPDGAVENTTKTHRITLSSPEPQDEIVVETTARVTPGAGTSDDPFLEKLAEDGGAEAEAQAGNIFDTLSELWVETLASIIVAGLAGVLSLFTE